MKIQIPQIGPCDCEDGCNVCHGEGKVVGVRVVDVSLLTWIWAIVDVTGSGLPYVYDGFGIPHVAERVEER